MEVAERLVGELEALGFSKDQATKALCSGASSVEDAIYWIVDHEVDPAANETPIVDINIDASSDAFNVSEKVMLRAQKLRNQTRKRKEEQEKKLESEMEKERIRAGKELLAATRMAEENERKRFLAQRKAENEEERKAREKIRHKLQHDKLERSGIPGLPRESPPTIKPELPQKTKNLQPVDPNLLPVKHARERELMRECLRSIKRQNKDDNAKATRAFQTLLIYVNNVANNPDEEIFRKIRIVNPAFQDRVGKFKEGIEFLELCGFERDEGGGYLLLHREKVDTGFLRLAGSELQNALTNPFFGLLSG